MIDGKFKVMIKGKFKVKIAKFDRESEFGSKLKYIGKYYVSRSPYDRDEWKFLNIDYGWHHTLEDSATSIFDTFDGALRAYEKIMEEEKIKRDVNGSEIKVGMKIRSLLWCDDEFYPIVDMKENRITLMGESGNVYTYQYGLHDWELESEDCDADGGVYNTSPTYNGLVIEEFVTEWYPVESYNDLDHPYVEVSFTVDGEPTHYRYVKRK